MATSTEQISCNSNDFFEMVQKSFKICIKNIDCPEVNKKRCYFFLGEDVMPRLLM